MFPIDLSAEVAVLGREPVAVEEGGAAVAPVGLPRIGADALFKLASPIGFAHPYAEAHLGVWHADFATGLAYDTTVLDLGIDLGYRVVAPEAAADAPDRFRVRPFADVGIGLRGWELFQPWWADQFVLGTAACASAGVLLGGRTGHVIVRVRYETVLADGAAGVLDSAASDLTWALGPEGGHLHAAVGYGWR